MSHESFQAHHDKVKTSSDRSFGIVIAVAFMVVALWPLFHGGPVRIWAVAVAAGLGGSAVVFPRILAPFNRLWTKLGLLLHKLVSPVILGLIFLIAVMPMGLMLRLFGKDLLRLRFDPSAGSYWIPRDPPGPKPDSLPLQF